VSPRRQAETRGDGKDEKTQREGAKKERKEAIPRPCAPESELTPKELYHVWRANLLLFLSKLRLGIGSRKFPLTCKASATNKRNKRGRSKKMESALR
jgi:hypothetical protein